MYQVKNILPDIKPRVIQLPKIKVGCMFRAQKYRSDGTITYQGPWFKNTVLNTGLDQLRLDRNLTPGGGASSAVGFINVGTGTSEPLMTNTGLDSYLASTSTTYGSLTVDYSVGDVGEPLPCWKSFQQTLAFGVGFTSTNVNLTELGLSGLSNSTYFNRQLFRDEFGDPAVINVQSDEGLRVTVKTIIYGPLAVDGAVDGAFTLNGVNCPAEAKQLGGSWLTSTAAIMPGYIQETHFRGVEISDADGAWVLGNSMSHLSYTSGDFYRDYELTYNPGRFVGDWKRIRTYMFSGASSVISGGLFLITLDAAETIADTEELKMTIRRSWGRV